MNSLLGKNLISIQGGIRALPVQGMRIVEISNFYKSLKTEGEQDEFIKNFEAFWFKFSTLQSLTKSLVASIEDIEKLEGLGGLPTTSQEIISYGAAMVRLLNYWQLIIADIYALTELVLTADILTIQELEEKFEELKFLRTLRAFYQHPEPKHPYERFGDLYFKRSDEELLPYVIFGPRPGGVPFYLDYHQKRSGTEGRKFDDMMNENKMSLIKMRRWDALGQREKSQLKGWGVDAIDQKRLSEDLIALFRDHLLPSLNEEMVAGKEKGII